MAHLINKMAYVGETPWHGLGSRLTDGESIEVWTKEAGLDFTVERAPVQFMTAEGIKSHASQDVLYRNDNFKELGIFSRRPRVTLVIAAMMIGLIFRYSEVMLLLLAVVYVSSGPVGKLHQLVRKLPIHVTPAADRNRPNRRFAARRQSGSRPNTVIQFATSPRDVRNCRV